MRHSLVTALATAIAVIAGLVVPGAHAERGLALGLSENAFLWGFDESLPLIAELDVELLRVNIAWSPGATAASEQVGLTRLLGAAEQTQMRVVVALVPLRPELSPQRPSEQAEFCGFGAELLRQNPSLRDMIVGNEPNTSMFWQPQFGSRGQSLAPAAYAALAATCYDSWHGVRAEVNVIGPATSYRGNDDPQARSNISHSPARFIAGVGAAYRASGRRRPLFDTIAHHPYPNNAAERPWREHPDPRIISMGDLDRLIVAHQRAFAFSAQPTPGRCVNGRCISIWYTEVGFQSLSLGEGYSGRESDGRTLPERGRSEPASGRTDKESLAPDQLTQVRDALLVASCSPAVKAHFNFQLRDEPGRAGWQSGLLRFDWSAKPAYELFRDSAASLAAADCSRFGSLSSRARTALTEGELSDGRLLSSER